MKLLTALAQNPKHAVVSTNTAQCQELLTAVGILNDLKHATTPNLSMVITEGHETHWVIAALYSGHPTPDWNGYQVTCLPKSQTGTQKLREIFDRMNQEYGGHSLEESFLVVPEAESNQGH